MFFTVSNYEYCEETANGFRYLLQTLLLLDQ